MEIFFTRKWTKKEGTTNIFANIYMQQSIYTKHAHRYLEDFLAAFQLHNLESQTIIM